MTEFDVRGEGVKNWEKCGGRLWTAPNPESLNIKRDQSKEVSFTICRGCVPDKSKTPNTKLVFCGHEYRTSLGSKFSLLIHGCYVCEQTKSLISTTATSTKSHVKTFFKCSLLEKTYFIVQLK